MKQQYTSQTVCNVLLKNPNVRYAELWSGHIHHLQNYIRFFYLLFFFHFDGPDNFTIIGMICEYTCFFQMPIRRMLEWHKFILDRPDGFIITGMTCEKVHLFFQNKKFEEVL